jgi:hypothetical protein
MRVDRWRQFAWGIAGLIATAILLSWFWRVPYLFTLIGAAAWAFFGHIITLDEDLPGGWGNLDGSLPFPWRELAAKALVLGALVAIALLFPSLRAAGGG